MEEKNEEDKTERKMLRKSDGNPVMVRGVRRRTVQQTRVRLFAKMCHLVRNMP